MKTISITPIGYIVSSRTEPVDDGWDAETSLIQLNSHFTPDAIVGLEDFSHIEVVYHFHLVAESEEVPGARHPRDRTDWPRVGIFAQRGKVRPNRIGVTVCKVLSLEGTSIQVRGLDAINGTPVLDIKPYMPEFGPREAVRSPAWSKELMAAYWTCPSPHS